MATATARIRTAAAPIITPAAAHASSAPPKAPETEPELILEDTCKPDGVRRYLRRTLIGQGGFAKVYEMKNLQTGASIAGKIICKDTLTKLKAKKKLEIHIHQMLNHKHIVKFLDTFEDDKNVYLLLELCLNKSMSRLMRLRQKLSEPEVRYYFFQIIDAVKYLHQNRVIHRDLKLGNVLLNENLAYLMDENERKKYDRFVDAVIARTLCGTPNYMAPEVLDAKDFNGHSYEVISRYTVLFGKAPFETKDVKTTYSYVSCNSAMMIRRIKQNQYSFPTDIKVTETAKSLIRQILAADPHCRPSLDEILAHPFFSSNEIPMSLPPTALRTDPYKGISLSPKTSLDRHSWGKDNVQNGAVVAETRPFAQTQPRSTQPLTEVRPTTSPHVASVPTAPIAMHTPNRDPLTMRHAALMMSNPALNMAAQRLSVGGHHQSNATHTTTTPAPVSHAQPAPAAVPEQGGNGPTTSDAVERAASEADITAPETQGLNTKDIELLKDQLYGHFTRMTSSPSGPVCSSRRGADVWLVKWVDYSHRYGLGYQMSDGTIGVYYNDATKVIIPPDSQMMTYVDRTRDKITRKENAIQFSHKDYPPELRKKVILLSLFTKYLNEEIDKIVPRAAGSESIYVKKWLRTNNAMLFRLSNRTVQINFFDHTKVILSDEARVVTYFDKNRMMSVHDINSITSATDNDLISRLVQAKELLAKLVSRSSHHDNV